MRKTRIRRSIAFVSILGAIMFGVAATANVASTDTSNHRVAVATVQDVNGNTLGTVSLFASGNKLALNGRFSGLTAGFHGFHVHAVGKCEPRFVDPTTGVVTPFGSAGGHLNPGGAGHGAHAGDLPLLLVSADGTTTTATATDRLNAALLFDADRSAVIIHALPDNYAHIPPRYLANGVPGPDAATLATGDAGGRVACGILVRG